MTQIKDSGPAAEVMAFLRDLEAGDVAAAIARTGPGFTMQFPGGVTFTSFVELFDWARGRYTGVRKSFERIDAFSEGETAVIHISGTLSGHWLDGGAFSGIRYIDRFDLKDGLIVRQTVWNDMGEAKVKRLSGHGAAISSADRTTSA